MLNFIKKRTFYVCERRARRGSVVVFFPNYFASGSRRPVYRSGKQYLSDRTCFHFHQQISWHIAWVTHPHGPNQKLCCEATQQLKHHTRCFFPPNYITMGLITAACFCKTAAPRTARRLVVLLLSAAARSLALRSAISIRNEAVISNTGHCGMFRERRAAAFLSAPTHSM